MDKPVPPADLWERLDAELMTMTAKPPQDSFSLNEIADRYGIGRSAADSRIRQLEKQGKIRMCGRYGPKLERRWVFA